MSSRQEKNLITDIEGIKIGQSESKTWLTGVSIILCETPFNASVHVCGGGPGTRETELLAPHRLIDKIDAIVFSGGSVYGLAAADQLTSILGAQNRGYGLVDHPKIPKSPIIPAAILYDLANGGNKQWGENPPYAELAKQAFLNIGTEFELGNKGAGMGAIAGQLKGGTGSVSSRMKNGICVAAFSCVNSFGSVITPTGKFWAKPYEQGTEFGGKDKSVQSLDRLDLKDWSMVKRNSSERENTTLCLVATNLDLTKTELKQISIMAGNGMARAIRPVFTPFDGDVIFALSNGEKKLNSNRSEWIARTGMLAADCVARSIARAVYCAHPIYGYESFQSLCGERLNPV